MRNKISYTLMALVAMSFLKPAFSQTNTPPKAYSSKIKTPNTSKELMKDESVKGEEKSKPVTEEKSTPSSSSESASPRRLRQHGLGLGLGQTFLLGNYGKYGQNKITADVLYTYAASYSFDLLIDAHMSKHTDKKEAMELNGLTGSIKGRFVEYDNFSPYFLGGLGFYAPRAKRMNNIGQAEWSDSKITFGLNFGGGVDLRLNDRFVVGILGQMHVPFAVQQDSGTDLRGYYFKMLLTGMYLF